MAWVLATYVFAATTVFAITGWLRERRHHRESVRILADGVLRALDKNEGS